MASTAAKLLTILSNSGIVYQLRADFPVDATAPMGQSPITYHAEVGQLKLTQQDNTSDWYIANGALHPTASSTGVSSSTWNAVMSQSAHTRVPGLAMYVRARQEMAMGGHASANISPSISWQTANISADGLVATGLIFSSTAARNVPSSTRVIERSYTVGGNYLRGVPGNTYVDWTLILRSQGMFALRDLELDMIYNQGDEANMYAVAGQTGTDRNPPSIDEFKVGALGGPWADSNGIATSKADGAVALSSSFTHTAQSQWVEFTLTTLPSANNIEVDFRRVDASNLWRIQITSAGAINLIEVVAGTPTTRLTLASNLAGDQIAVGVRGHIVQVFRSRAGSGTTSTSAYTRIQTGRAATDGVVSSLGTGGVISNLRAWPRFLTGEAAAPIVAIRKSKSTPEQAIEDTAPPLWYRFNEASGASTLANSGSLGAPLNATITGAVVTGYAGAMADRDAIDTDGANGSVIIVPGSATLAAAISDYTLGVLTYTRSSPSSAARVLQAGVTWLVSNNQTQSTTQPQTGDGAIHASANSNQLLWNGWLWVFVTYVDATKTLTFYRGRNGAVSDQTASRVTGVGELNTPFATDWSISNWSASPYERTYDGLMDELAVWPRVLSPAEMLSMTLAAEV